MGVISEKLWYHEAKHLQFDTWIVDKSQSFSQKCKEGGEELWIFYVTIKEVTI